MNSYVFLTHCDLWQASQHWFLLLSVHTPYHQGYVCVCKKSFLAYSMVSCNRPRMAGACLHCIRCCTGAYTDMWKIRSAITAGGGVRWTGLLYGPKTESGSLLFVDLWNGRGHERKVAPPGVEPRTSGLSCQYSATELRRPPATVRLCFCGWNCSVAKERWLASACLAVTTATV